MYPQKEATPRRKGRGVAQSSARNPAPEEVVTASIEQVGAGSARRADDLESFWPDPKYSGVVRSTEGHDPLSVRMAHLLVRGLPGKKGSDGKAVFTAFVRVCTNAVDRGWTWEEFSHEVTVSQRFRQKWVLHVLWQQLLLVSRSEKDAHRQLRNAWQIGMDCAYGVGERHPEYLRNEALERAYSHADRLDAGTDGLTPTQIKIMRYVIEQTEKRGWLRVTCPCREVGEAAGVTHMTASRGLKDLVKKGLLVLEMRGTYSTTPGQQRASIYRLADLEALLHISPVGIYVTPTPDSAPDYADLEPPAATYTADNAASVAPARSTAAVPSHPGLVPPTTLRWRLQPIAGALWLTCKAPTRNPARGGSSELLRRNTIGLHGGRGSRPAEAHTNGGLL